MVNKNWKYSLLSEVCDINPTKKELQELGRDTEVSFLRMAAVSAEGKIIKQEKRKLKEVIKGYTNFRNGDILLAKITPCFENGKRAKAENLTNGIGFGSTEFHVLRPKREVTSDWIFYAMSQNDFRNTAKSQMTGTAGQKRVPTRILEQYKIPVPCVKEQETISDTIETQFTRLDVAIKALRVTKGKLEFYRQSILKAAFSGGLIGFDVNNSSKLGEVTSVRKEKIDPQSKPNLQYIGMADVEAGTGKVIAYTSAKQMKAVSARFVANDVLYGRLRPYLNKVVYVDKEGLASTEFIVLRASGNLRPLYLARRLRAADFVRFANGLNAGDRPRVKYDQISSFEIRYPSTRVQDEIISEIESRFSVIDKVGEVVDKALKKAKRLRQSILKAAFEGKLVD